jgi:hypothetical protein
MHNERQMAVLVLGVVVLALMCLFPPWKKNDWRTQWAFVFWSSQSPSYEIIRRDGSHFRTCPSWRTLCGRGGRVYRESGGMETCNDCEPTQFRDPEGWQFKLARTRMDADQLPHYPVHP